MGHERHTCNVRATVSAMPPIATGLLRRSCQLRSIIRIVAAAIKIILRRGFQKRLGRTARRFQASTHDVPRNSRGGMVREHVSPRGATHRCKPRLVCQRRHCCPGLLAFLHIIIDGVLVSPQWPVPFMSWLSEQWAEHAAAGRPLPCSFPGVNLSPRGAPNSAKTADIRKTLLNSLWGCAP